MQPTREEEFQLTTQDGKVVYGIISHASTDTDKVMVIAHGMCGNMCEHLHMDAKRFFSNNGFDVVRFNFYSAPDNARKLEDGTLATQAADLNLVCDHFRPIYKKLFVAGHSYGGQTLLVANPKADAFSFWDSSFTPFKGFWEAEAKKLEDTPYYTIGWGFSILISEAMYEEGRQMDTLADGYAKKITTPSQVILAGESSENPVRTALYDSLSCAKTFEDIEGADHWFTKGDTLNAMFKKVLEWFNKF